MSYQPADELDFIRDITIEALENFHDAGGDLDVDHITASQLELERLFAKNQLPRQSALADK